MEILTRVHARNLVAWAKDKPETVVLSADLTSSCEADAFREAYPDRFYSMGIAEQNMLSFAGGLAREGYIPMLHTFAVFLYRRAFDQLAMSVAYPNLPVKLFGFLPGVTTPGGATHQAIEDIGILRVLPNMTIFECGDATDVASVLDAAYESPGPVYIRMLRGEIPRIFEASDPLVPGKHRVLSAGRDLVLLTSGICTEEALRAVHAMTARGLSVTHFHVTTLKPFHAEPVLEAIQTSKYGAVTMENHSILGGLGSIIAEVMAEAGLGKKLTRIGIQDTFLHGASKTYLMKTYGLDAMALIGRVEAMIGAKLNIEEADLEKIRIAAVHSQAKAEAL